MSEWLGQQGQNPASPAGVCCVIARPWQTATCGQAMPAVGWTCGAQGCCRKGRWERYRVKRCCWCLFDPVPRNCTSCQGTPKHPSSLAHCHEGALLSQHTLELPLFFSPFLLQNPNLTLWLFSFNVWETSCCVVTVSKKFHRKNVDTVQMAQLRSIQCHCWAHSIRECWDRTPQANWLGLFPQEEIVGCLCMHAQKGGNCMLSAAWGEGGSSSSPLHLSFSKHLLFTAVEGMGYGCWLGHHWRVSDGGESEDVLKQRSSMFGGWAATPLPGPPGTLGKAHAGNRVQQEKTHCSFREKRIWQSWF